MGIFLQKDFWAVYLNQYSAGAKKKGGLRQGIVKSRGGFISKIHAVTDKNGKAMRVFITGGNIYDNTQAEKLLYDTIHEGVHVLGDKAFDSE